MARHGAKQPRRGGRLHLDCDEQAQARNIRWFLTHVLGHTYRTIAAAEPKPVHEDTVRKGATWARRRIADVDLMTLLAKLGHERLDGAA